MVKSKKSNLRNNSAKHSNLLTELADLNTEFKDDVKEYRVRRDKFDVAYVETFGDKNKGKARFITTSKKGKISLAPPKAEAVKFQTRHKNYKSKYKTLTKRLNELESKNPELKTAKRPKYLGVESITLTNLLKSALEIEMIIQDENEAGEIGGSNPQGETQELTDVAQYGAKTREDIKNENEREEKRVKNREQKRATERGEGASSAIVTEPNPAPAGLRARQRNEVMDLLDKDATPIDILEVDPLAQANTEGMGIGVNSGGNMDAEQKGFSIEIDGRANQVVNEEFAQPPENDNAGASVVPKTSTDILTDTKGEPKFVNEANGGETQAENINDDDDAFLDQLKETTRVSRNEYLEPSLIRAETKEQAQPPEMGNMEFSPEREAPVENELVSRESLEGDKLNVFTAEKAMSSNASKLNMEQLKLGIKTFHSLYDGVIPSFTSTEHQAGKKKALESKDIKTVREHFLKMEMLVKAYFSSLGGDLSVGVIISASDYFKSFGKESMESMVWNSREPTETRQPDDNADIVKEVIEENQPEDDPADPRKMNMGAGRKDTVYEPRRRLMGRDDPRARGRDGSGWNSMTKEGDTPKLNTNAGRLHFTQDEKWSKHENQHITNLKGANPYNTQPIQRNILTRQGGVKHRYSEPISGKEIRGYTPNTAMGYINDPTLHQDVRQPVYLPQPVVQRNPSQFVINAK